MDSALIADVIVSLAALAGLITVISTLLGRGTADPLSRRFLFGLWVVAVLLSSRVLGWTTGLKLFEVMSIAAAGTIPLASLMLTEGLLRRHAPFFLKLTAALGAVSFGLLAFLPDHLAEPWRMTAMLVFQFGSFVALGWLVVTRDRKSLSAAENRTVERIALSLLLILPLLITDYRLWQLDMPVRLGGIAILFLCWLALGVGRSGHSHRDTIGTFAVTALSAVFAGVAVASIADVGWRGSVQDIAIVLSATLVAAIYNDSVSLRIDERRETLLRHLAYGDISDSARFLRGLQNHVLVEGALVVTESELEDFDLAVLAKAFATDPVRSVAHVHADAPVAQDVREQLSWLFEKYEATHVLLAAHKPLTLVALSMPALATSPGAETELRAVQRTALLISQRDGTGWSPLQGET